jgi:hypothetical protein
VQANWGDPAVQAASITIGQPGRYSKIGAFQGISENARRNHTLFYSATVRYQVDGWICPVGPKQPHLRL